MQGDHLFADTGGTHTPGRPSEERDPHLALVYESRREQFASVVPFVRAGLTQNDRCFYYYHDNSREEVVAALKAGGIDVDTAVAAGDLVLTPATEAYLDEDGAFDSERMVSALREMVADVEASDEHDRIRVSGENTWLDEHGSVTERFLEYECQANEHIDSESFVGMCQFDARRLPEETIAGVLRTHPQVAFAGQNTRNVHYTDRAAPDGDVPDVDQALSTLRTQATLRRQVSAYERVNELNESLREASRELVRASTVEAVREAACRGLASLDDVRFVWTGDYDPVSEALVPSDWSGEPSGYLDDAELAVRRGRKAPAVRAALEREPVVVPEVDSSLNAGRWRERLLAAEFRSVAAVPLVYEGVLYGVLAAYSDRPGTFGEPAESLVAELGELVAHSLNAIERKKTLLADRMVTLEFDIRSRQSPILRLAAEADCRLTLQGTVPESTERTVAFFRFEGAAGETVAETAAESVAVVDHSIQRAVDRRGVVRLELQKPFIASVLAEHGVVLRSMTAADGRATAEVAFPDAMEVQSVREVVESALPEAELVSKSEQPTAVSDEPAGEQLLEELTTRQVETLRAAYHAGYFEQPRQSDGEDVAEVLDIASPTFHQHRRVAINTLLEELFEG